MQVDVAGGGTVTYVDDTLFPIAKVRVLQQHLRPPPTDALCVNKKWQSSARAVQFPV
jgi:hypothetical protein